ncbi:hypothetical protein ISN39_34250 (plasmid) [Rhizobium sp. 007]|nr:hypothetical protein ISN39_34250 [Rhizobium sp. 007]
MGQSGQARQVGFEQHLAEARRADPAPVASGDHDRQYPHLSSEHRRLIDRAITHVAAQHHLGPSTVYIYTSSLRRLANDLGARGQAIDLKNHQSLADHVDAFFPENRNIKSALNALRTYHEPGYSAPTGPRMPSKADAHVLEQVTGDSRLAASTRALYGRSLRKFSEELERRGQTISGLDHDSRIKLAESLFPADRTLLRALNRVREAEAVSAGGSQEPGRAAPSLMSDAVREALRPLFDDRADEPPTKPEELLRLEQGYREVLQGRQDDRPASSFFSDPGMPAGKGAVLGAAGQARQVGFEQHLAEARRADPAPVASGDHDRHYPHLSSEHRRLIDQAITHAAAQQHYSLNTVHIYTNALRRLANDLGARGQAIDLKNHQSLADHVDAYFPENRDIKSALNALRTYHEPGYSAPTGRPRMPSKADAHVLKQVTGDSRLAPSTRALYGRSLRKFSEELERRGQTISGLDHDSRIEFAKSLFPADRKLVPALNRVREAEAVSAGGSQEPGRAAPSPMSDAVREALRPLFDDRADEPPTKPEELLRLVQGYREVLQERQDDRPASSFFSDPGMPAGLDNLNSIVADAFAAGSGHAGVQAAAPPMLAASEQQIRPSPDALDQGNLLPPDTYRGVPLVDLTTSSDAEIGAFPSGSSNLPKGAVLGAAELLSDAHIHRDYQLLAQDLQEAHPALAARTRLVDAMVSHQLRRPDVDVQDKVLSIYHQNDAPADFVFLPVNSADPMDPAPDPLRIEHWSLLLVDRRDPERAVAYHYDSIQHNGQGYNDAPAQQLATRLDATTLVSPAMARQNNGVDCGVFVVDGTRELVRRLANEERPAPQLPLDLNYLVADRQALQNRLREERLPHELAAIPAEAFVAAGSQVQHAVLQEQQARQVAPAPFERHLGKTREAQDELTSTLDRSNLVNSGGVIINTAHYTALLIPAKRQRTDNPQSLPRKRQLSEIGNSGARVPMQPPTHQLGASDFLPPEQRTDIVNRPVAGHATATTTSISKASEQARADLVTSFRSRERSDAGR